MKKFLALLAFTLFPFVAQAQTPGAQPEICVTNPSQTANYNQLCLSASASGGTVGVTNFGSATGGLSFTKNGTVVPIPGISGTPAAGWIPVATSPITAAWFSGAYLDVRAFGAKCANDSTDDTAALNSAITASQSLNGAPIFLPGFCHTTGPLNITGYTHIFGTGPDSGLKPAISANAIVITTQASIILENFSIQYPTAANAMTQAVTVTAPAGQENVGSVFNNVQIILPNYGFYFIKASKFTIMNSGVQAPNQNAIVVQNTNNGDSGDSTIINNQLGGCGGACIYWASSGGLKILSNKINIAPIGIQIALASGVTSTGVYITANSIEGIGPGVGLGGSGAGVEIARVGTADNLSNVIITGNEIVGSYGVHVPTDLTGAWLINLTYVGNIFEAPPSTTAFGASIDSTTGFNVAGNVVFPSAGGTTRKVLTGSAASHGSIDAGVCNGSCAADSISSATTTEAVSTTNGSVMGSGATNSPGLIAQGDGTSVNQIIVEGKGNSNQQLVLGYDTTNNAGSIAALIQGTGFSPLKLNPGGGAAGGVILGGNPTFSSVPTSAGSGGLFLCIDTSGVIYKKSSCP